LGLFSTIGILLFVTQTPVVGWAKRGLVIYAPLVKTDAIVVLGGGVRFDGELTDPSLRRLVYGLRLFRKGYAPVVILTGGNPKIPDVPESVHMERVARELGFSPQDFIVETEAKRTSEQARAVAQLVRAKQMKSVILVTSPTHSYRALRGFEKVGVKVIPGTTEPLREPEPPGHWWEGWFAITPRDVLDRLSIAHAVLYEYTALALYWWNGWI
jgi:uncharacterized SAM-binding protein YcdF (DUF218 family)